MQTSGWVWSHKKRDLDAAKWWGLIPSQFYELSKEDKLDLLAMYEIDWRIQAINNWEANEKAKRHAKRKARK